MSEIILKHLKMEGSMLGITAKKKKSDQLSYQFYQSKKVIANDINIILLLGDVSLDQDANWPNLIETFNTDISSKIFEELSVNYLLL